MYAQLPITTDPPRYGPFNAVFLTDGKGLIKPMVEDDSVLRANSPWSLYCWMKTAETPSGLSLIAGIGDPDEDYPRFLALYAGRPLLFAGRDNSLMAGAGVEPGKWVMIAATFDGSDFRLYSNGVQVASGRLDFGSVSPAIWMAPTSLSPALPLELPLVEQAAPGEAPPAAPLVVQRLPKHRQWTHFGGSLAAFTILRRALSADEIRQLNERPPDFALLRFEEGSKSWPVQTRGQAGYRAPQDPTTFPHGNAPFSQPVARAVSRKASLESGGGDQWTLGGGWQLQEAPKVTATGAAISQSGFDAKDWLAATVPGTVLTTLIDRGVYPDSDYGLNNLAIPESLNQQDYWYRNEFKAPGSIDGRHLTLTFHGINYKAQVWLNGQSLGSVTGAFIRGVFDVTGVLKPGQTNVLAVRVSPPPHPGIPREHSIRGGPGENGGIMCLDGPTFVATEGWDWIPAIRDRNTGIWQSVTLAATAAVKIGDPQVVTRLPLPDTSRASVEITVPVENTSNAAVNGTLTASFEQVKISKNVTVPPGKSEIKLAPSEFAQLNVQHPRLWWPNGYGKPELYNLTLTFAKDKDVSDSKQVRFGIREITYELSLFDQSGHLRRVEYSPAAARERNEQVVDVSHSGMREIPNPDPIPAGSKERRDTWNSWVASLAPGGESSAAIRAVDDTRAAPYLVIKVNGVRIACRGGNWGMDDSRKRVSREKLEPYFRLHRDANLNIIRNWVGQNTEETFYDLADEYGLLVWNDFWASTQNYNVEPQDPAVFLDNVRDTLLRFRNHPSIAVWCGRNEGVPQPILNEEIANLVSTLDGTRYYSPSSNEVNLQTSGPYKYMDPELYYTELNRGFSVETGTPSLSTLESLRAWIPPADQWPISDTWAYHDWHQGGNGVTTPFMEEIQAEFGAPRNLEDLDRKAQMLNYVQHRAIFEGMNAHLWAPNSGRMLWMTQPAWPSNMWQILSSDYDTQASFYGVKKACEPLHVQLDLSNYNVDVINTTANVATGLLVVADVYSLQNKLLLHRDAKLSMGANSAFTALKLELAPLFGDGVVLVKLALRDASGHLISDNFYWLGQESASYRQLNRLPAATLEAAAASVRVKDEVHVRVQLKNTGGSAALANKLTLLSADGTRILPAYFSDNYVSLLPGETREIEIEYPAAAATGAAQIALRGWNLTPQTVPVTPQK